MFDYDLPAPSPRAGPGTVSDGDTVVLDLDPAPKRAAR